MSGHACQWHPGPSSPSGFPAAGPCSKRQGCLRIRRSPWLPGGRLVFSGAEKPQVGGPWGPVEAQVWIGQLHPPSQTSHGFGFHRSSGSSWERGSWACTSRRRRPGGRSGRRRRARLGERPFRCPGWPEQRGEPSAKAANDTCWVHPLCPGGPLPAAFPDPSFPKPLDVGPRGSWA